MHNVLDIFRETDGLALHAGLVIALVALALSLGGALWAGYLYRPGKTTREIARVCYRYALFSELVLVPFALYLEPTMLGGRSVWAVTWPMALAPVIGVGLLMEGWRKRYFAASLALLAGAYLSLLLLG